MRARWPLLVLLGLLLGACGSRSDRSQKATASAPAPSPAPGLSTAPPPGQPPGELRLVTYNVLASPAYRQERVKAVLELLEATQADVIALQEVADWWLSAITEAPWVKSGYHLTQRDGHPFSPGGQLLLSKFPITSVRSRVLPGGQGRTVVVATLDVEGLEVVVANTHMESPLDAGKTRAAQLDAIFDLLPKSATAIFLGDVNFGDGEKPDADHLPSDYADVWRQLRPSDPGFTWNNDENPLAYYGAFANEPNRRLDRVLVRSRHWRPHAIRMLGRRAIGTKPLGRQLRLIQGRKLDEAIPSTIAIFPSDHYGLLAVLREPG